MFAGINAVVIKRRQRYDRTNNKITQLPVEVRTVLVRAYGDYNESKDKDLLDFKAYETFSRICQENGISVDDFVFWWNYYT